MKSLWNIASKMPFRKAMLEFGMQNQNAKVVRRAEIQIWQILPCRWIVTLGVEVTNAGEKCKHLKVRTKMSAQP